MSKPVKEFKSGAVKLCFWENTNPETKKRFISVSMSKSYKDKEGNWKDSDNFSEYDLGDLVLVCSRAAMDTVNIRRPEKEGL